MHAKTGPGANFIATIHRPVGNSPQMGVIIQPPKWFENIGLGSTEI